MEKFASLLLLLGLVGDDDRDDDGDDEGGAGRNDESRGGVGVVGMVEGVDMILLSSDDSE